MLQNHKFLAGSLGLGSGVMVSVSLSRYISVADGAVHDSKRDKSMWEWGGTVYLKRHCEKNPGAVLAKRIIAHHAMALTRKPPPPLIDLFEFL